MKCLGVGKAVVVVQQSNQLFALALAQVRAAAMARLSVALRVARIGFFQFGDPFLLARNHRDNRNAEFPFQDRMC